jgi:hypothetical protein
MPLTIKTAPHNATKHPEVTPEKSADDFFKRDWSIERCANRILASTFTPNEKILNYQNGFVDTVVEAYNKHYNLIIRPDDVWIAILSQFSYYINAHAEELRNKFVGHEGQKELSLLLPPSTLEGINWDALGDGMIDLMDENLVDKELKAWIMPAFSTTTRTDTTVSAMLMMACMKKYLSFSGIMSCGIPNVTLEGTKEDWLEIQKRLEKLDTGDETTNAWSNLLKPVLKRFIAAFDGEVDEDFWSHVVTNSRFGSGSPMIGGWITAFCRFTEREQTTMDMGSSRRRNLAPYILDGAQYPSIRLVDIASGSAEVEVKINDAGGQEFQTVLFAGNMGMRVTPGEGGAGDTVQNVPMWCCCLKREKGEKFDNDDFWP